MGRAAKVQSFFESAMTDFTEQLHYIDMLNSQEHVREFLKSLTEGAEDHVIEIPLDGEILWQKTYLANVFTVPEDV